MSQTNTAVNSTLQRRLGTLVVIPWAGEHHEDGRDMPFLMAYSLGDGPDGPESGQEAALAVAEEVGLPVGGAVLDVKQAPNVPVKILVEGGQVVLTMPYLHAACPVPEQWVNAAQDRGAVYFILATRAWPEAKPGTPVTEETLQSFAGNVDVLGTAAHCLVPVGTLKG
ncbi:DUF5949 family protein [Actinacidiphila alni]|uniref:Uncharacterized protein n=1 Tax=Actinacidiphila alni TaxID=380248 RepID=A0A1I1ZGI8_9ACTN|nr:DUF5949 family protein [Actinacidiphila alni]SFE30829.1 hypothetical protein SAMN05216251_102447 [Actinacidiphila alni]